MSLSPFSIAMNSRIVFKIAAGGTSEDKNGNLIPNLKDEEIQALLKPGNPTPSIRAGMDDFDEYLQGYLVIPIVMPATIVPLMEGEIIRRVSFNTNITGTFRLLPQAQNPFVIAAGVEGVYQISGLFRWR